MTELSPITIRLAVDAVRRAAQLDSAPPLTREAQPAETRAAASQRSRYDDGRTVADAFRPTRNVVDLLRRRQPQILVGGADPRRAGRRKPRR